MAARDRILIVIALLLLAAAGWVGRYLFIQSPEEQLQRAQTRMVQAVEKRDWSALKAMTAEEYADDFGFNRDTAMKTAQDLLGGYFSLTVKAKITELSGEARKGFVRTTIQLEGTGTPVSQMVTSRVNATHEPWVFHWVKKGRWPWNWKLVKVENEGMQ